MKCEFESLTKDAECIWGCGHKLKRDFPNGYNRNCPLATPGQLGDVAASFFESIGITKERFRAAKEAVGLDASCRCEDRQEYLNKIGEQLGINDAIARFNQWRLSR